MHRTDLESSFGGGLLLSIVKASIWALWLEVNQDFVSVWDYEPSRPFAYEKLCKLIWICGLISVIEIIVPVSRLNNHFDPLIEPKLFRDYVNVTFS